MLSNSSGMSAGQAGGYFSRGDYYRKGAGQNRRWRGKGAESLELAGSVREKEFRALCAIAGRRLATIVAKHQLHINRRHLWKIIPIKQRC
jgi:hypothetical protein